VKKVDLNKTEFISKNPLSNKENGRKTFTSEKMDDYRGFS
jgi:hypothetical protein